VHASGRRRRRCPARDGEDDLNGDIWRFLSVEAWAQRFLDGRSGVESAS
jgi:hypothetical protein